MANLTQRALEKQFGIATHPPHHLLDAPRSGTGVAVG